MPKFTLTIAADVRCYAEELEIYALDYEAALQQVHDRFIAGNEPIAMEPRLDLGADDWAVLDVIDANGDLVVDHHAFEDTKVPTKDPGRWVMVLQVAGEIRSVTTATAIEELLSVGRAIAEGRSDRLLDRGHFESVIHDHGEWHGDDFSIYIKQES